MTTLLTRPQVAKRLLVSERTVRRLVDDGKLAAVKVGRSVRFTEEALAAFLGQAAR